MNAAEAARARYLDQQRRYNLSAKGQARNARYEGRHPERKLRWEPARNRPRNQPETEARGSGGAGPPSS